MKQNKILSLLGLARKSGNVVSGEFQTEKAVKAGKAELVIISREASDNTKNKFQNMCGFYHVPFYIWGDSDELGHAIGREFRMSVAVMENGFAEAIMKQMKESLQ